MKQASGKFILRIKPEDHEWLRRESVRRGLSLNELCQEKLGVKSFEPLETALPGVSHLRVSDLLETAKALSLDVLGILLFGSYARGEAHQKSDVDILIVLPDTQEISRSLYTKWDKSFEKDDSQEISIHFVHLPQEVSSIGTLWLECALDGKVLYESTPGEIEKFLSNTRKLIAEGRWRRQYVYGQPYWIGENHDK